ncbi:MAG: magnesium transporter [Acidobacteria bacterium]|nr:magnesium transporter [Acidobacteriota bacterium]
MPSRRRVDIVLHSIKRLQRIGATANLVKLLRKQHPADLAQVLGDLSPLERRSAFTTLLDHDSGLAMQAVAELDRDLGVTLLVDRPAEQLARLFAEIPPDDAAALIDRLPGELNASVLEFMRQRETDDVQQLLEHDDRTAGRIMNPEVFALSEDLSVGNAIKAFQESRTVEMVFYLYVIDTQGHLVGVLSLRRLLLVSAETTLKEIMTTEPIRTRADTHQEDVAREVADYNLLAIPVVDGDNKLAGVITVDDVIDVIKDEATEDMLRLAGVPADESVSTSPLEAWRKRLPWLAVNLGTAVLAALVVQRFQATIDQVVALAAFMTIVASMGGNAAIQTLTVIVRGIALGELTWGNSRRALGKEVAVGILNGVVFGLAGAGIAWSTVGNLYLGGVLALAMAINLLIAAFAGTLIPMALRALKADPALASAVFITTLTDVLGFFAFLGLATYALPYL